jgi:hypothetical protein
MIKRARYPLLTLFAKELDVPGEVLSDNLVHPYG